MNSAITLGIYEMRNGEKVEIFSIQHTLKQPAIGIYNGDVHSWDLGGTFRVDGRQSSLDIVRRVADAPDVPPPPAPAVSFALTRHDFFMASALPALIRPNDVDEAYMEQRIETAAKWADAVIAHTRAEPITAVPDGHLVLAAATKICSAYYGPDRHRDDAWAILKTAIGELADAIGYEST